jgi:endonuclease/exonuclease/phosphatase family metal-dependent hydrolase
VTIKLLSYNICRGGAGREHALQTVISLCAPDIVIFQEATQPAVVERIAQGSGMTHWASRPNQSLAFVSRIPIEHYEWHRPRVSRHAFLEVVPEGMSFRIFGLHLSAVHAAWTERRRGFELRALLRSIAHHQDGFHALVGDFNTLAPGELLDVSKLPGRLRALVWLSGGWIRWRTIEIVLAAGYRDAFRARHSADAGLTFPTWGAHVRLDYLFVPSAHVDRVTSCEVVTSAPAREASDHFPLLAEIEC